MSDLAVKAIGGFLLDKVKEIDNIINDEYNSDHMKILKLSEPIRNIRQIAKNLVNEGDKNETNSINSISEEG